LNNFFKRTGLNTKELSVIGFLLLAFAAGVIIKFSGWKKPVDYDYSQSDKSFEEKLSKSFNQLKEEPADSNIRIRSEELNKFADSLGIKIDNNSNSKQKIKPGKVIDINTADIQEFMQLPGIGEVTAEKIIEYRNQKGRFIKAEDIMNVKGIGEKKYKELKNFIIAE
jgi:competence ComEA-like helix-hairpin-helix protein